MSDVIETEVVELQFDSTQFVENVSKTVDTVDKLKESLQFEDDSFKNLSRAAANVDFSSLANNIESLSDRFSTFGIVGMTVIQRITNAVIDLGSKIASKLTAPWRQIISGGTSRAEKIAQADFQLKGIFGTSANSAEKLAMTMSATAEQVRTITGYTEDLVVAMDAANYAVADTAYGLDSAAKAASVLATSGIDVLHFSEDLKDSAGLMRTEMQVALRAISGTAAMANSDYDSIAHIFEKIAGNTKVMTMDLRSLSAHGLNATATLRDYLNEINQNAHLTEQEVGEMVTKGKIDFMTFAKAMDSAYGDHAKDANNTFTGAFSNMKFALSKIGADFIAPLRDKMIPVLNDVRMAINNVRKALQFKMKFPGVEEEISIVQLFTNVISNLTARTHQLFATWMGGQDSITKSITAFSDITGMGFSTVKKLFDSVEKGSMSVEAALNAFGETSEKSGEAVNKVITQLAENLDKTEDEIREMCKNGEISFEEFSNAVSSALGNTVWDKRVSQLAAILQNFLGTLKNIADAIGSVIGPILESFFNVFLSGTTVGGIVGITEAIKNFTNTLRLSMKTQDNIRKVATGIFKIIKGLIGVIWKLVTSAYKIFQAIRPLLGALFNFALIIVSVITGIINLIAESKILSQVINILTKIVLVAGAIVVKVITTVIKAIAGLIGIVVDFFSMIADGVMNLDFRFITDLADRFRDLISTVFSSKVMASIKNVIAGLFALISGLIAGIITPFQLFNSVLDKTKGTLQSGAEAIIGTITWLGNKIKEIVGKLYDFVKSIPWKKIAALVGAIFAFSLIGSITTFTLKVSDLLGAFGKQMTTQSWLNIALGIEAVAKAIFILIAAFVVASAIPFDKFPKIGILVGVIIAVTAVVAILVIQLKKLFALMNVARSTNPMQTLSIAVNNFLTTVGEAAKKFLRYAGLGILLISVAAGLLMIRKAIQEFGEMDFDTFGKGFLFMALGLGAVAAVVLGFEYALKDATAHFTGIAITLLAFLVVIKALGSLIMEYSKFDWAEFGYGLSLMAAGMIVFAAAFAVIGQSMQKVSGFGMMGAAITMLAFLIVLKAMKTVIEDFATINIGTFAQGLIGCAAILFMLALAFYLFSESIDQTEKSFSASWKGGINSKKTRKQFGGLVLTLLALSVVLKTMSSVMKDIKEAGFFAWIGSLILFGVVTFALGRLVESLSDVKLENKILLKLAAFVVSLALVFAVMQFLDPVQMVVAAVSISMVILALAGMINLIVSFSKEANFKTVAATLIAMVFVLGMVGGAIAAVAYFGGDWKNILSSAVAMAALLVTLAFTLGAIGSAEIRDESIKGMLAALIIVGAAVAVLSLIPVKDIGALWSLVGCISVLGIAMAAITKLMSMTKSATNAVTDMMLVATVMGVVAILIATAAAIGSGKVSEIYAVTESIVAISSVATILVMLMSVIGTAFSGDAMKRGIIGFTAMIGILGLFTLLFMAATSAMGNPAGTVLVMKGLASAMNEMFLFLGIMSIVLAIIGNLAGAEFALGAAGFGVLLTFLGVFAILMGVATQMGDPIGTVLIMIGLAKAMNEMFLFLVIMSAVLSALGFLAASMSLGVLAFGELLLVLGAFAAFCAEIGNMGNPASTVLIMRGLSSAMTEMLGFLAAILGLLTALGILAFIIKMGLGAFDDLLMVVAKFGKVVAEISLIKNPTAAALIMVSLGNMMSSMGSFLTELFALLSAVGLGSFMMGDAINRFEDILEIIAGFGEMMAQIAQMGDAGATALIMLVMAQIMNTLIDIFLRLGVIGKIISIAQTAIMSVIGAMSKLLIFCQFISKFDTIMTSVVSGLGMMLFIANTMKTMSDIVSAINLAAIATFVTSMSMLKMLNLGALLKLSSFSAVIMLVVMPLTRLAAIKKIIETGCDTGMNMMNSVRDMYKVGGELGKLSAENIIRTTEYLLTLAETMAEYSAHYTVGGFAEGLLNDTSRGILYRAANSMGNLFMTYFNNRMGIHSNSDEMIEDGHWCAGGLGEGSLDQFAQSIYSEAANGIGDMFGGTTGDILREFGLADGNIFAASIAEGATNSSAWGSGLEAIKNKTKKVSDLYKIYYERALKDPSITNGLSPMTYAAKMANQDIKDIEANYKRQQYFKNRTLDTGKSDKYDYGHWTDDIFNWDDLTSAMDLSSVMDSLTDSISGLGDESGATSKQIDGLISKIDDLMDEYEKRWDTAKERAAKDLFKGVDDQGDDFLSKVRDIMDQYKNIYATAVEKTNGQNLFEEVKEDEESFAPDTLLNNLEDQVNQINEFNTIIDSLSQRVTDENLRAALANMDVDDLPQLRALFRMNDKQLDDYQGMYKKKIQANQNKIQNELTASLSQLTGEYTNVATYVADDATTERLMQNLQSQIDKLNDYNATIGSLMDRIQDMDLRSAIANMSEDDLPYLKMLEGMSDAALREYEEKYRTKVMLGVESVTNEVSAKLSAALGTKIDAAPFYESYDGTIESVIAYLNGEGSEKAKEAGAVIGSNISSGVATGATSDKSKSAVTTSGTQVTKSMAEGLDDKDAITAVTTSAGNVLKAFIDTFDDPENGIKECGARIVLQLSTGISGAGDQEDFRQNIGNGRFGLVGKIKTEFGKYYRDYYDIGKNIAAGIAAGIDGNSTSVTDVINNVCGNTILRAQLALGVHSPSRVFMGIGKFIDEGLAMGLRQYASLATDESENLANGTISAVQEAINNLSGMLDGSIDVNPTITPTLDLSEVNAKSAALANMFNGRQVAVQAQADEQQAAMVSRLGDIIAEQNAQPKQIIFNQTNNSPKALSRTEIYRQSRNAFSQLASAVT